MSDSAWHSFSPTAAGASSSSSAPATVPTSGPAPVSSAPVNGHDAMPSQFAFSSAFEAAKPRSSVSRPDWEHVKVVPVLSRSIIKNCRRRPDRGPNTPSIMSNSVGYDLIAPQRASTLAIMTSSSSSSSSSGHLTGRRQWGAVAHLEHSNEHVFTQSLRPSTGRTRTDFMNSSLPLDHQPFTPSARPVTAQSCAMLKSSLSSSSLIPVDESASRGLRIMPKPSVRVSRARGRAHVDTAVAISHIDLSHDTRAAAASSTPSSSSGSSVSISTSVSSSSSSRSSSPPAAGRPSSVQSSRGNGARSRTSSVGYNILVPPPPPAIDKSGPYQYGRQSHLATPAFVRGTIH